MAVPCINGRIHSVYLGCGLPAQGDGQATRRSKSECHNSSGVALRFGKVTSTTCKPAIRPYFIAGMQPEVEAAVRAAVATLAELGAVIVPISLPQHVGQDNSIPIVVATKPVDPFS